MYVDCKTKNILPENVMLFDIGENPEKWRKKTNETTHVDGSKDERSTIVVVTVCEIIVHVRFHTHTRWHNKDIGVGLYDAYTLQIIFYSTSEGVFKLSYGQKLFAVVYASAQFSNVDLKKYFCKVNYSKNE